MKKRTTFIWLAVIVVLIIAVVSLIIITNHNSTEEEKDNSSDFSFPEYVFNEMKSVTDSEDYSKVIEFHIGDFQGLIERSEIDESIGTFADRDELLLKVEELFAKYFGEDAKQEKPYITFYDSEKGAWLVCGSHVAGETPDNPALGGVGYVIVEESDGNVLAMWHGK